MFWHTVFIGWGNNPQFKTLTRYTIMTNLEKLQQLQLWLEDNVDQGHTALVCQLPLPQGRGL